MSKKLLSAIVATLLLTLPAASDVRAQTRQAVKVSEVVRSQLFVPLYVALTKGYFSEQGLTVELSSANGGDRVGALVLGGGADIGLAGPEVPIYIFNGESPDKPVIFCALSGTDGFFLGSRNKVDKFEWSMLEGKSLFGLRKGSTPQLFWEYLMKKNNVSAATIDKMVTNIALPNREGAWISGTGEFAVFNEPAASKLEAAKQFHVIDSIGRLMGRAENTVFFAKKSWIEKNPEAAQKFTNGIGKAQHWMKSATDEQIAEAIAPHFPGLPPSENIASIKRFRNSNAPIFADDPVVDPAGLAKLQEVMVIGKTLPADKVVKYEAIVDPSFGQKAKALMGK
ncbi:MAG: ABC transporter substrate-binding protein [Xanthobacteraceae bacterium]|nr:ABC transporter substrate-binding protein [Xanthobacteraceae bacterium]